MNPDNPLDINHVVIMLEFQIDQPKLKQNTDTHSPEIGLCLYLGANVLLNMFIFVFLTLLT